MGWFPVYEEGAVLNTDCRNRSLVMSRAVLQLDFFFPVVFSFLEMFL